MRHYHDYILASSTRRLYVGVTGHLLSRLAQHRAGRVSHTARYRITRLVYAESTHDIRAAIGREKQLKSWRRRRKLELIASANPGWDDLAEGMLPPTGADPSLRSG